MKDLGTTVTGGLLACILFSLFTVSQSLGWRRLPAARVFLLVGIAQITYVATYAMELTSTGIGQVLFWNRVQYLVIPFIAPGWVLLAIHYTGRERDLNWFSLALLFLIPFITLIIRWTPSLAHLIYASTSVSKLGTLSILEIGRGPWYMVAAAHITSSAIVACGLFVGALRQRKATKRDVPLLLFAALLPLVSVWLLVSNLSPSGLDTTPITLTVGLVLFFLVFFKYRFLDLVPLARDKVFTWSKAGLLIVDSQHRIADFNIAAQAIFPELAQGSTGRRIDNVLHSRSEFIELLKSKADGPTSVFNDGELSGHFEVKMAQIYDRLGSQIGLLVTLTDVTEQVEMFRRLEHAASMDETSGIANRRHAMGQIQQVFEAAVDTLAPVSLLMVDLDLFKQVNDQFGHPAGDIVLRDVATLCSRLIRSVDIIGRYGGDEFVIALPGVSAAEAQKVAERIRAAVEQSTFHHEGREIRLTVSIGLITATLGPDAGLDALLMGADQALYTSKANGRNRVEIHAPGSSGHQMPVALRSAEG